MKHLFTTLLLLFLFTNTDLVAQSVERGPYLQMLGSERVNIRWRTDDNTSSKVWYGTNPNSLTQTIGTNSQSEDHEVVLSGLQPNTKYYYAIGTASQQLAGADDNHYFITSPENATEEIVNIWVLGDAGKRNNDQRNVRDAFYQHHGDAPIHMALLLGDNAYSDGSDYEYQTAWFEDMYEDRLVNMPLFSAYGNHDAYSANSTFESGPYYDIFSFPKNAELGGLASGHEGFYSFDYGDIHIISINDYDEDMTTSGDQYQWLEEDLEANNKNWIFVICHYPPHDSRSGHSDNSEESTAMRETYMPLLESYGVDLVLAGHSHSYQRSHLITGFYGKSNEFDENTHGLDMGDGQEDGDGAYQKGADNVGTMYVVSGSAGSRASLNDDFENPAMAVNHMMLGSVRLQLSQNKLFGEFINDDGIIMDYWTLEKEIDGVTGSDFFSITNPLQEGFAQPQPIIVTHEFTDTTDELTAVEYYVNGLLEATITDYPFYWNYTIPAEGDYEIKAIATTANGAEYSDHVSFEVGSVEVCKSIVIGTDDAEEKASGYISVGSSDLELTQDGTTQHIGLRFSGLNIPKNAEITNAHIQFTTDETNNIDPSQLTIYGEASDVPASYVNNPFSISNRPKTQSQVSWSPQPWLFEDASETAQKTPDVSSVVQELVNRSGYEQGAALAFIINGQGRRTAHSADGGSPGQTPKLCLAFTPDYPNDSDGDGTIDSEDLCAGGLEIGAPCTDFDPVTHSDSIGPNCDCVGIAYDCATFLADFGTPCDDGNATTIDDVLTTDCECLGISIFDCPTFSANIGTPCDDGSSTTYDDKLDANCNCVGTPFDCPVYLANVGTTCDDGNPATYNEVLDVNCNCTGTDYDCPNYLANIGDPCDDGNPLSTNDMINSNCECAGILVIYDCPVLALNIGDPCDDNNASTSNDQVNVNCECTGTEEELFTVSIPITLSSDDAEERPGGSVSLTSSDLELMVDGSKVQKIGLRFQEPGIPVGAVILNADVQFQTDEVNNVSPASILIYGETHEDSPTFQKTSNNISNRNKTSASVEWLPTQAWNLVGEQGEAQRTNDIAILIQEIIDQSDYEYNNAITLLLEGNGRRVAESFDGNKFGAPVLNVTYNFVCIDDDDDGICNPQDDCPDSPNNPGTICDDGNPDTVNDVIDENCVCNGTEPMGSACAKIITGWDDGEEKEDGSMKLSSSDLELVVENNIQKVGLRFQDMLIPPRASITSASIQFTVDENVNINPCELKIYGQADGNPAQFAKVDFDISNRNKTNQSVNWSPDNWTAENVAEEDQRTTDLTPIIQEIVNRPDFYLGNPIVIIIEGIGRRVASAFESGAEAAPELCIAFDLENNIGNTAEEHNAKTANFASTKAGLSIFPNPARDHLNLVFDKTEKEERAKIQVVDVNGKVLLYKSELLRKGDETLSIDNLNLPNGVYYLQVNTVSKLLTGQFVIVR